MVDRGIRSGAMVRRGGKHRICRVILCSRRKVGMWGAGGYARRLPARSSASREPFQATAYHEGLWLCSCNHAISRYWGSVTASKTNLWACGRYYIVTYPQALMDALEVTDAESSVEVANR